MIKINGKLDITDADLVKGIESRFKSAVSKTSQQVAKKAHNYATSKLGSSGQKHWERGFKFDKLNDDTFVLSLSGKLTKMMEEGFTGEELKSMILSGARAKKNKSEGKDYVDIPIPKDKKVAVKAFKDADALMGEFSRKEVTFSQWQKGGGTKFKTEQRDLNRVGEIIQSRKTKGNPNPAFLTIKRITPDSKMSGFNGIFAFEWVGEQIDSMFTKALKDSFK